MISRGYFKVPESILRWPKEKARRFIWEMFNYGGRISVHEYQCWLEKIERPTVFQFKNGRWVQVNRKGGDKMRLTKKEKEACKKFADMQGFTSFRKIRNCDYVRFKKEAENSIIEAEYHIDEVMERTQ